MLLLASGAPAVQARNLSDAMEKAAEKDPDDRVLEDSDHHHHHDHYDDGHSSRRGSCLLYFLDALFSSDAHDPHRQLDEPPVPVETPPERKAVDDLSRSDGKKKLPNTFSISAGSGFFKGDDLYPLAHMDIALGSYFSEKTRPEIYLGLGFADIDASELLDSAIRGPVTFYSIGVRLKQYTTALHDPVGHYWVAGLAYTGMSWRYENEIYVDGHAITYDGINGLEAFCGMGFNLAQTEKTQFGLEVLPTVIWWGNYTDKGFDNDVFGDPLMIKVRLVMSWL